MVQYIPDRYLGENKSIPDWYLEENKNIALRLPSWGDININNNPRPISGRKDTHLSEGAGDIDVIWLITITATEGALSDSAWLGQ